MKTNIANAITGVRILDYGAALYTYIEDMKESIDKVTLLNRAS